MSARETTDLDEHLTPAKLPGPLALDAGLFELDGPPRHVWAFTCPTPGCDCRTVLMLASSDRDLLLQHAATVRNAAKDGGPYYEVAAGLRSVQVFTVGIDLPIPCDALSGEPLDRAAHADVLAVAHRIDGEILDAVGRLWFLGKGWPDPEAARRRFPELSVKGWKPGLMVGWNQALDGLRRDLYELDDGVFRAEELYCPDPACACNEVQVMFHGGGAWVGTASVKLCCPAELAPSAPRERDLLAALWAAFEARHPRYQDRFARRYAVIRDVGPRLRPWKPPISRSAPCPCGSGKKYKRCCGRSAE